MNVLLDLAWHIVVDDCFDAANIETARGEVGGEQVVGFAGPELGQCIETLPIDLVREQ